MADASANTRQRRLQEILPGDLHPLSMGSAAANDDRYREANNPYDRRTREGRAWLVGFRARRAELEARDA